MFLAGFDLTTDEGYADMMDRFDRIIGLGYLKAMHINDSKGGFLFPYNLIRYS